MVAERIFGLKKKIILIIQFIIALISMFIGGCYYSHNTGVWGVSLVNDLFGELCREGRKSSVSGTMF